GTGVFGHPQVVEDQADVACELSHFLRDASSPFGLDDSDGESAKPGDVFRAVTGRDATAIFIIVPIENVVAAILDRPVPAVAFDGEMVMRLSLRDEVVG